MRKQLEIKKINEQGRCEAHDLSCPFEGKESLLTIMVQGECFCNEKCANDYHGELSEGTFYPFPNHRSAPSLNQRQDNEREYYDRYVREYA